MNVSGIDIILENIKVVFITKQQSKGFTLVELSIVLVIIGLIVSGVVAGQSLIHSARLNKVVQEVVQYRTAIRTFEDQYGALPGDMVDATEYWGKDNVKCSGDSGTAATPGTCNGDGNRELLITKETVRGWQQLSLSEIISGGYTGVLTGFASYGSSLEELAATLPTSATGGMYTIYQSGGENVIGLGMPIDANPSGAATFWNFGNVFAPADAYQIDKKMDDGVANTGRVKSGNLTACKSGSAYDLSNKDIVCALSFSLD